MNSPVLILIIAILVTGVAISASSVKQDLIICKQDMAKEQTK